MFTFVLFKSRNDEGEKSFHKENEKKNLQFLWRCFLHLLEIPVDHLA